MNEKILPKILFLARKLKNFTLDEIAILTEIQQGEIKICLEKLVKDDVIQKTKSGYVLKVKDVCKIAKPRKIKEQEKFYFPTKNSALLKQIRNPKPHNDEAYKNAPIYNRKKADKYLKILEMTKGLHGEDLEIWIEEYNSQNPDNTISSSNISRKRVLFLKYGKSGLVTKYGGVNGRRHSSSKHYEFFKELYLTQHGFTMEQCLDETADYFGITRKELPVATTYYRWLHKEFTAQEIKERREYVFS